MRWRVPSQRLASRGNEKEALMASGFLRAVAYVTAACGFIGGVAALTVLVKHHQAAYGVMLGLSVIFGSAFYAAVLWLFTNIHDDVARIRESTTRAA
jgi:hypothetical protein